MCKRRGILNLCEVFGQEVDLVGDDPLHDRRGINSEVIGVVVLDDGVRRVGRDLLRYDWTDEILAVAGGMWRAIRANPHAIPLLLTRRSLDLPTLVIAEALLQALARSGRSGAELLIAFRAVSGFITGLAQAELAGPLSAAREPDPVTITERIAALPPDGFAKLIEIAHAATGSDPEDEFRSGLSIILTG
ncbi:TetR/AcrR family transcriptional regulator C-terminal domain-containing protein [Nocardia sp. NBC_01730]|uniref:TetR/AcrR family transcriptional regulator C-terminal domain-containing protein n=1 Tax=Nocardia sp. NBC_01730 TaxID=2975998 RepID=UPI002E1665D2|nr:TetR/AcrR family transcriptional regulator C-terminal domain-containing protein [Nocardia sp. NBC_01730]